MLRALGSSRTREKEPCDRVLSLPCGFHTLLKRWIPTTLFCSRKTPTFSRLVSPAVAVCKTRRHCHGRLRRFDQEDKHTGNRHPWLKQTTSFFGSVRCAMAPPAATVSSATSPVAPTNEQSNRWHHSTASGPSALSGSQAYTLTPVTLCMLQNAVRALDEMRPPEVQAMLLSRGQRFGSRRAVPAARSPDLRPISFSLLASSGIDGRELHMLTFVAAIRSSVLEKAPPEIQNIDKTPTSFVLRLEVCAPVLGFLCAWEPEFSQGRYRIHVMREVRRR